MAERPDFFPGLSSGFAALAMSDRNCDDVTPTHVHWALFWKEALKVRHTPVTSAATCRLNVSHAGWSTGLPLGDNNKAGFTTALKEVLFTFLHLPKDVPVQGSVRCSLVCKCMCMYIVTLKNSWSRHHSVDVYVSAVSIAQVRKGN